jgi:hypothetical protein
VIRIQIRYTDVLGLPFLERGPTAEYVVSKSMVEGFDGSEVSLTISLKELNNQTERSKNNRTEGKPRRGYTHVLGILL